jgi:glycosyltransferase involved in cell wall biosynthesis
VKIRVLEVLASLRRAGAERVAVSIASGIDATKFETAVVSLYDAVVGDLESVLAEQRVPVWRLGKRRGFDPRMWLRLGRTFRRVRPDIIHTHSYVLRYVLPASAAISHARIVHTVHNVAEREVEPFGRLVHRIAFRSGTVPVAISSEIARSFRAMYGIDPAAVIPNGVDVRAGFRADARRVWRQAHGFADGDLLMVSLARLEPQKDPEALLDAFARGLADRRDACLIMAGEGSLLEACRRRAAGLGIARRVLFAGLCQDVPELLSACDLFASASKWEGSPVSILEAMAARLPVVATMVGGVPEVVENGVTGLLVKPEDTDGLARALRELSRDESRRREMGAAAAERVQRFDSSKMVESYGALFERLCQEAR